MKLLVWWKNLWCLDYWNDCEKSPTKKHLPDVAPYMRENGSQRYRCRYCSVAIK